MPALCHLLLLLSCCALDSAIEEGKYTLYIYQFVVNTSFTRFYLFSVVLFNCSQVELVYNMSSCGHIYPIYSRLSDINLYIFLHNKAYQICPNASIIRFTHVHPCVNSQLHMLFTHIQILREIHIHASRTELGNADTHNIRFSTQMVNFILATSNRILRRL